MQGAEIRPIYRTITRSETDNDIVYLFKLIMACRTAPGDSTTSVSCVDLYSSLWGKLWSILCSENCMKIPLAREPA